VTEVVKPLDERLAELLAQAMRWSDDDESDDKVTTF
jgi:hypothetical protein